MKTKTMTLSAVFSSLLLVLLMVGGAFAGPFEGELSGTAESISVNGNKDKFSEYADMKDEEGALFTGIRLGYDSDAYWFRFRASDIGYKTQNYELLGGKYGVFSANLFYNEIIHNISTGKTFYGNPGSDNLTFTGTKYTSPTAAGWQSFDFSVKREQTGGDVTLDVLKPFYLSLYGFNELRSGINTGADSGYELPTPVRYRTTDFKGELGYQSKPLSASVSYFYSDFDNKIQTLSNETTAGTTFMEALPPDNQYYKFSFNSLLQLPMHTKFNVNLATAHGKSTFDLTSLLLNNFGDTSVASSTSFHGKRDTDTVGLSLSSRPLAFLDSKVFYKYYSTKNKSDRITVTDPFTDELFTNSLFDYKKNTYGAGILAKLPLDLRLNLGYTYLDTDRRGREDIAKTRDNVYLAELRWVGLDYLTPRISYERLSRTATYGTVTSATAVAPETPLIHAFDADKQKRDTYKIAVDITPLSNLNVGLAYKYKKSDYSDVILGLQNTKTNEFDISADYKVGSIARLSGYFDLQNVKYQTFDVDDSRGGTNPLNPAVNISTSYPWTLAMKDNTYEWGAGADVYVMPNKLTLRLQYDYVNSDGNLDFSIFNAAALSAINPAANNSNIDIASWDNYKKSAFTAKVIYIVTKSLTLGAGAAFEQYKYNDIAYNNYLYNANNGFISPVPILAGAYANPSYNASIVFVSAAYRF